MTRAALPSFVIFAFGACGVCGASTGCRGTAFDPVDAAPSPQASAEPAPLANVPAPPAGAGGDSGLAPEPLRGDRALPSDVPHEVARDPWPEATGGAALSRTPHPRETARDAKELAGYGLQAVIRTGEAPPPPKGAEVNFLAVESAKRKTEPRFGIELSQTRARFVPSGGFVLPAGTELRARVDRYGHLVVSPGDAVYRVAEPGALRALLGERRFDVAPISPATLNAAGEGSRRLNMRTRRVDVATRAAKASLEIASLRDAGEGGVLVCRLLLDLISASPSTPACSLDDVPLHAEIRWTTQGAFVFDVVAIARRFDLVPQELAAPPASAAFEPGPFPALSGEALVSKADLAAFRNGPTDTAPQSVRDAQPPPPEVGLLIVNSTDELRFAWIDGVAVAWVAPGGKEWLSSLIRGHYVLQWRTFLGDAWEPARPISVPGSSDVGGY